MPQEVVRPAGWTDVVDEDGKKTYEARTDEDGKELPRYYMVTKDGAYQILVKDGDKERWIPCDEDGSYYLSYTQEYYFTTAQHYGCDDGFAFTWDDCVSMTAAADHKSDTAPTTIKKTMKGLRLKLQSPPSTPMKSKTAGIYNFTGTPLDADAGHFKTNDGIKTEMYLSGKLTHTRVTVTQSQLFKFDHVLPMITYNKDELAESGLDAEFHAAEGRLPLRKIFDENNYVKAERHEVRQGQQRGIFYD